MLSGSRTAILLLAMLMSLLGACASTGGGESALARDAAIETSVLQAIEASPALNDQNITASSSDGVVTLSGEVPSSIERTLAERLARSVEGVVSVTNDLTTP